jgi:hypothetical protein
MARKIPLGQALRSSATGLVLSKGKLTDKERITVLEQQVTHMQKMIQHLKDSSKGGSNANAYDNLNKDGIPVGLECWGTTEKQPFLLCLTVNADYYTVGHTKYDSLSAAAEAVSGVRRSGWTFWKLHDGRTLKEAFKKG